MDILPGLISKVCILLIFHLSQTSFFLCLLIVALGPYVSMGIVACLGQLLAINNDWTDGVLIISIVGNICQSLSLVDQWECGFNLLCILFVLEWGSSSKDNIMFGSYWLSDKIQCCTEHLCQWLYSWWQSLTIIFMVIGTILILHSSTTSYNVNRLLHFMFVSLLS